MPAIRPISWALLGLAIGCGGAGGHANDASDLPLTEKIGVVDVGRILAETTRGREIQEQLAEAERRAISALEDLRAELQAVAEEIQTAQAAAQPNREEIERLVAEYSEAAERAQAAQGSAQAQLEQLRAQLTEPLVADVREICEELGREEDFDLILERGGATWVDGAVDITDRVARDIGGGGSASLLREALRAQGEDDPDQVEEPEEREPDEQE